MCIRDSTHISRKVFFLAYGSSRHCRHCALGYIAYSRLLRRFFFFGRCLGYTGTRCRRPNSFNVPRPFRHLQLVYVFFTEKEIYGVWGMVGWWGCIAPFEVVVSCPHVADGMVLVCPHFPSLRYILPQDVFISVWNDWFMTSCCNGCRVLPSLVPASPKYTLFISLMMSSYSSFYEDVLYHTTASRSIFFQLKMEGRAETFESWPSEKGFNSNWRTKSKADPWLIWSRLSQRYMARFASWKKTLENDSGDIKAHVEICTTEHCGKCRKTWYWLRGGKIHWWLEFLQLLKS